MGGFNQSALQGPTSPAAQTVQAGSSRRQQPPTTQTGQTAQFLNNFINQGQVQPQYQAQLQKLMQPARPLFGGQ